MWRVVGAPPRVGVRSALCTESREVVRCGLGALRQLTHADHTKLLLAERHAAELLMQVSVS